MKIWFQKHIVRGRLPALDRALETRLPPLAGPGAEIAFHTLPPETYAAPLPERYVRHGVVESLFATWFALQAIRAERAGYDAFVIGTAQDPGLPEARGWAAIPVLGFGETAMHAAAMLARRFAFVGFIPELAEPLAANARRYGASARLAGFYPVEGGAAIIERGLAGEAEVFAGAFTAAARRAIAAGAEILIPGDGVTNELAVLAGVTRLDGVPLIDANGLLVSTAAQFAALFRAGVLGKPAAGYYNRRPDDAVVQHLLRLFAPRAFPLEE
ncbi:MAG TPA: aspartate/glutamate racemase family protein [bacterium]|nr:aspartate/glutamate racemase family protein [bacterium]